MMLAQEAAAVIDPPAGKPAPPLAQHRFPRAFARAVDGLTVAQVRTYRAPFASANPNAYPSADPADMASWYHDADDAALLAAAAIMGGCKPSIAFRAAASCVVPRSWPDQNATARVEQAVRQAADGHMRDLARHHTTPLHRLIDGELDADTPAAAIEQRIARFNAEWHNHELWPLICRLRLDRIIADRIRAWRWRRSPRGRRALGR